MTTSILDLLKRDHEKVTRLLTEIEAVDSDEQRDQLFAQLVGEIEVHAQAEEDVFYATLDADDKLEATLDDARQEHDEVDQLLEEMDEIGSAGVEWLDKLRELRQRIQHHVDQEEGAIFERAREVLGAEQLGRLGDELERARRAVAGAVSGEMRAIAVEGPTSPPVLEPIGDAERDDLERLGRKELYRLARQRDIEGRATMSMRELVKAIRGAK